jgi:ABC-type nitrate/sulfonate/bicarbonate transport system substrate-binding protein
VKGSSDIQEPADLEGKTIAINTLNNISQLTVTAALDSEGVDTSTLHFVEVPRRTWWASWKRARSTPPAWSSRS